MVYLKFTYYSQNLIDVNYVVYLLEPLDFIFALSVDIHLNLHIITL
jgi:hypothetical protein